MYIVRKTYKVEYAHQLKSAFTACCYETIHGHSGSIEIFLESMNLDENEMVVDFGKISSMIKEFIMDTFDHALIIPSSFPADYIDSLMTYNKKVLITEKNPTAEYFSRLIFEKIEEIINKDNKATFQLRSVRFHETESGYAEYVKMV